MPKVVDKGDYWEVQNSGWESFARMLPQTMNNIMELQRNKIAEGTRITQLIKDMTEMDPEKAKIMYGLLPDKIKKKAFPTGFVPRELTEEEKFSKENAAFGRRMIPAQEAIAEARESEAKLQKKKSDMMLEWVGGKDWYQRALALDIKDPQSLLLFGLHAQNPDWLNTYTQMQAGVGPEAEKVRQTAIYDKLAADGMPIAHAAKMSGFMSKNDINGLTEYVKGLKPEERKTLVPLAMQRMNLDIAEFGFRKEQFKKQSTQFVAGLAEQLNREYPTLGLQFSMGVAEKMASGAPSEEWGIPGKALAGAEKVRAFAFANEIEKNIKALTSNREGMATYQSLLKTRADLLEKSTDSKNKVPYDPKHMAQLNDAIAQLANQLGLEAKDSAPGTPWYAGAATVGSALLSSPAYALAVREDIAAAVRGDEGAGEGLSGLRGVGRTLATAGVTAAGEVAERAEPAIPGAIFPMTTFGRDYNIRLQRKYGDAVNTFLRDKLNLSPETAAKLSRPLVDLPADVRKNVLPRLAGQAVGEAYDELFGKDMQATTGTAPAATLRNKTAEIDAATTQVVMKMQETWSTQIKDNPNVPPAMKEVWGRYMVRLNNAAKENNMQQVNIILQSLEAMLGGK